jgi:hypothetical protein
VDHQDQVDLLDQLEQAVQVDLQVHQVH